MKKKLCSAAMMMAPLFCCAAVLLQGCARTADTAGAPAGIEARQERELRTPRASAAADSLPGVSDDRPYDLEEEMLQEDKVENRSETIALPKPAASDSFTVKDLADDTGPAVKSSDFAKGYRVQVFASADAEKAREIKKNVIEGTGLAVYIEFEAGLYKVRVGDFQTREKAAEARANLASSYPDCWIVESTIRK